MSGTILARRFMKEGANSRHGGEDEKFLPPRSFPDDFYEHAFAPPAVKFSIEDLFPWSKVETAGSQCDHDLPAHYLTLEMSICIVLPRTIMQITIHGRMRGQAFQPFFIILVEPLFIVIDDDGSRDVHGIDQHEAAPDTAFLHSLLHLPGNIHNATPGG